MTSKIQNFFISFNFFPIFCYFLQRVVLLRRMKHVVSAASITRSIVKIHFVFLSRNFATTNATNEEPKIYFAYDLNFARKYRLN